MGCATGIFFGLETQILQVLPSDLFGGFKWPFQGLSDLHLGDQKVTWKKLAGQKFLLLLAEFNDFLVGCENLWWANEHKMAILRTKMTGKALSFETVEC